MGHAARVPISRKKLWLSRIDAKYLASETRAQRINRQTLHSCDQGSFRDRYRQPSSRRFGLGWFRVGEPVDWIVPAAQHDGNEMSAEGQ